MKTTVALPAFLTEKPELDPPFPFPPPDVCSFFSLASFAFKRPRWCSVALFFCVLAIWLSMSVIFSLNPMQKHDRFFLVTTDGSTDYNNPIRFSNKRALVPLSSQKPTGSSMAKPKSNPKLSGLFPDNGPRPFCRLIFLDGYKDRSELPNPVERQNHNSSSGHKLRLRQTDPRFGIFYHFFFRWKRNQDRTQKKERGAEPLKR